MISRVPVFPPAPPAPLLCRFESLIERDAEPPRFRVVFCVHVPKAAGNSMNVLLRQNRYFDVPIRGDDFFYYTPQERWLELARPGPATIFTGHFRLDHPLLRRMWIPYVTLSVLRHPVERMLGRPNSRNHRSRQSPSPGPAGSHAAGCPICGAVTIAMIPGAE